MRQELANIPEKLYALAEKADFPLYAVGGAVRDAVAGLPASPDIDLCAPFPPKNFPPSRRSAGLP